MNLTLYIGRRLLHVLPLFFLIPLATFFLMHLVPGNYFDTLRMNPQISPETIRHYETLYHLDEPVLIQYFHWLRNLLRLDFGYSFAYRQPVLTILASRLWNTVLLSGVALLVAWLAALLAGLLAGAWRGSLFDRFFSFTAYLGLSVPNFFLCLLLLFWALGGGLLPLGGMRSVNHEELAWPLRVWDIARHAVIPASVLGLGSFAYGFRLMRAETVELLDKDFVLYLRAQRIPESRILFKHVARHAVNPMVSLLGMELPSLFSGAALVEIFTGWPGLGQVMLQAVRSQDLFLVLGNMVMIAVLLVVGNLAADLLLVVVDPRIRLRTG